MLNIFFLFYINLSEDTLKIIWQLFHGSDFKGSILSLNISSFRHYYDVKLRVVTELQEKNSLFPNAKQILLIKSLETWWLLCGSQRFDRHEQITHETFITSANSFGVNCLSWLGGNVSVALIISCIKSYLTLT